MWVEPLPPKYTRPGSGGAKHMMTSEMVALCWLVGQLEFSDSRVTHFTGDTTVFFMVKIGVLRILSIY